jgi:hypothetical protein
MDEEALDRYLLGGPEENFDKGLNKVYIREYNRTTENNHR